MNVRIPSFVVLTFAAGLGVIAHSRALAQRPSDLTERVRGSQKAVVVKVAGVRARWYRNKWGDQLIMSRLSVVVEESLKGPRAESTLEVEVEGGTINGLTLHVGHQPKLEPGQRAVLLLDAGPDGAYVPHHDGQGVLRLDEQGRVDGTDMTLTEVRSAARAALR